MKIFVTEVTESQRKTIMEMAEVLLPRVLPADWHFIEGNNHFYNARWYSSNDGLRVALEVEMQRTAAGIDELWLHLSVSRRDRVPNYFDLKRVKELFIGRHRKAIQVFPPDAEHYNHHPHCLHLFAPIDRDPLPDFRHESGAL